MPIVNTRSSHNPQGLSPLITATEVAAVWRGRRLSAFADKEAGQVDLPSAQADERRRSRQTAATSVAVPSFAAFTLVELLVVIAITIIMFALLLRPLVESLRLTQSAQTQAAAQDAARITMERISRELGSAVFVYDNASHPFVSATAAAGIPVGARVDHFTNFLDLGVTGNDGKIVVEHAYDAKLDIVPARRSNNVGLSDPTNGNSPIQLKGGATGSATLSSTGLLFPLAPDSTIIRYFVGLKNPIKPYSNSNEGLLAAAGNDDNTYVLYVAQVSPYKPAGAVPNSDGTTINENLFAPMHDSAGNVVNKPELDDPDFFRYVNLPGTTDVNWLDAAHADYPTQTGGGDGSPASHNQRVDEWYKFAKPVITAPDIDLLQLPHNPDGSIAYDTTGAFNNVAHSGIVYDAVKGTAYPVVNTTVAFRPAVVEGDAAPATTTDYTSLGIPANAADNGGLPYIPTFYTAANQSWAYPYSITLYPLYGQTGSPQPDTSKAYYTTDLDTSGKTGDIIEYGHTSSTDTAGTAVYDVTTNTPVAAGGGHNYVPLSVKPDTGTISFDTPAYPDPASTYNRFFTVNPQDLNGTSTGTIPPYVVPGPPPTYAVDLTQFPNSPLAANGATSLTGVQVANARIVPGSVRVYGPDATPGPNLGSRVLYSQVSPGTPLGYNQYRVDYLNSQISLFGDASNRLPENKNNDPAQAADPVQIAYDYQANLAPLDSTQPISSANPANPMLVKVDYQTRDLLDVSIGVRIYDNGQSRSIVIPATNRVQIGNTNR